MQHSIYLFAFMKLLSDDVKNNKKLEEN